MTTKRLGDKAADIFKGTVAAGTDTLDAPDAGGKIQNPIRSTKTTVVMPDTLAMRLDALALDIRGRSGAILSRAAVMRAMVEAVLESGVDLTPVTSEADVRQTVAGALRGHQ